MKDIYILKEEKYIKMLLCSSHLFLINSFIAFFNNNYDYCFLSFCVYINSINYWRKPTLSLRRNIDIITATISGLYHKINIINPVNILSLIILYIGILFYIFSLILNKYNKKYLSVLSHIFLHIFTNMSCIFFYLK